MAKADLTAARLRELLAYDPATGHFLRIKHTSNNAKIGERAGCLSRLGYITIKVDNFPYSAHRLAWLHTHGTWPAGQIDHIDGNRANNRLVNLRDVTHLLNCQNKRTALKGSASGYLGVSKSRKKWMAEIGVDGKSIKLGTFDDPADAFKVYLAAKRALHAGNTL